MALVVTRVRTRSLGDDGYGADMTMTLVVAVVVMLMRAGMMMPTHVAMIGEGAGGGANAEKCGHGGASENLPQGDRHALTSPSCKINYTPQCVGALTVAQQKN